MKENAEPWQALPCITRIPNPLKVVSQVLTQARAIDTWPDVEEQRRSQGLAFCHFGIEQRGRVVHAEAAAWRAASSLRQAQPREDAAMEQPLWPWQASRFDTPAAAHAALAPVAKTWQSPQGDSAALIAHKRYANKGRPRADTPWQASAWQLPARGRPDADRMGAAKQWGACEVRGTHRAAAQRSAVDVRGGLQRPSEGRRRVAVPQSPGVCCVVVVCEKPCRMQGLLRVMTLALLVYAVAHRRLRHAVARQNATLPNHIHQPTSRPTLRWVGQRLAGIERVRLMVDGKGRERITGWHEVRMAILRFFGEQVCLVYQVPSG